MKAIETIYKGYRFRSRLEARWAVFFDTLGIPFEYEKEGYDLGNGVYYLPDFWLPTLNYWIEIKPSNEWVYSRICDLFSDVTTERILYLCGNPFLGEYGIGEYYHGVFSGTDPYGWATCKNCGALGITMDDYHFMPCSCLKNIDDQSPRLIAAYKAARQAQFEHGKHGN